jgi:hypothetical protein
MPGPSSISRPATSPLTNTEATSSSTSADNKTSTTNAAHTGPKAGATLGGLPTMNGGGAAKRASFAASKPTDGTQASNKPSLLGRLGQAASAVLNDTTGLESAAVNAFSGEMQLLQAESKAIADVMTNGAKNVQEASKG